MNRTNITPYEWKDSSYKQFFTFQEFVSDFIKEFIPYNLIGDYDPLSLHEETANHINKVLIEKMDDKIWSVKTKNGKQFYLYILFEFQTTSDKEMALRVAEYSILFIRDLYKQNIVKQGDKHPPILPIVIYTSSKEWTAAKSCIDLCEDIPLSLKKYQIQQNYFLFDAVRLLKESLNNRNNLSVIIFRMQQCSSIEDFLCEIKKAKEYLKGDHYSEFRRVLSQWIRYMIISNYRDSVKDNDKITSNIDMEEIDVVIEDTLQNLRKLDKEEGKKEGEKNGRNEERKNNVISLYSNGFSIEQISIFLGIKTELIRK